MAKPRPDEPPLREELVPVGRAAALVGYFRYDAPAGFLAFLIALPLCLGIALASGFPAITGVFTAVVGSVVATLLSNSELTIKGPAAGLIVVLFGAVEAFGGRGFLAPPTQQDIDAYRMVLAVCAAAAALQIGFGLLRGGVLGEFFPHSAVHGMLAAIGVIIVAKQIPILLGVRGAKADPLTALGEVPRYFTEANPAIAAIGGLGLLLMFLWPAAQRRVRALRAIPAPLVVLLAAAPLGASLDLMHPHTYRLLGREYELSDAYLVDMPERVLGVLDDIRTPDWRAFDAAHLRTAIPWVLVLFVIGSLESLLSATAIDLLDPWKRKTDLNRDVLAVGVGNLGSAMIGGLPMISEIVRSRANIDNGARTRFANLWHGVFLLLSIAFFPMLLHRIPLAALAAMLIYTGIRLAHPREFLHVYSIGSEQLVVFIATLVGVLATDLLIGVLIGIGVKLVLHWIHGVPLRSLFLPYVAVDVQGNTATVHARSSAVFSNWILFRRKLMQLGVVDRKHVVLDLSGARLVDHSVMRKLYELEQTFAREGLRLEVTGLDGHRKLSDHKFATRKRTKGKASE